MSNSFLSGFLRQATSGNRLADSVHLARLMRSRITGQLQAAHHMSDMSGQSNSQDERLGSRDPTLPSDFLHLARLMRMRGVASCRLPTSSRCCHRWKV